MKYRLLVAALPLLLAGGITGGCQGDGSDPTTEGYFRKLGDAGLDVDERLEEHQFKPDLDSEKPPVAQITEWFDEFILIHRDYAEALAEIDPPPEVAEEHAELVAAVTDLTDIVARSVGRLDTVSEVQQLIEQGFDESDPEVRDASQRFDAACAALREAALRNDVSTEVEC